MGKAKAPAPGGPKRNHPRIPSRSIEELVRDQGAQPVRDLDELGALLPADADPDELLAFVESERGARRAAAGQRHP
jgi:hypothetical protein